MPVARNSCLTKSLSPRDRAILQGSRGQHTHPLSPVFPVPKWPTHRHAVYQLSRCSLFLSCCCHAFILYSKCQNGRTRGSRGFETFTGGLKMHDMKMQDWKMTDNILANYEQNYGVWKMQDWKMTDHVN